MKNIDFIMFSSLIYLSVSLHTFFSAKESIKVLTFLLATSMILTLSACGGKKEAEAFELSKSAFYNIHDAYEKLDAIGNDIITEISNIVKTKMAAQYVFVRYMGPKFVIVFSGVEETSVEEFLKELKNEMEELEIVEEAEEVQVVKVINGKKVRVKELKEEKSASPKINFVVSTYYKGTGIEQLNKKLEEYLDSVDKSENQINYI